MATRSKKTKAKSTPDKQKKQTIHRPDTMVTGDVFDGMLETATETTEIEFSFMRKIARISYEKYEKLLRFFSVSDRPVTTQEVLNVSFNYNHDWMSNYRITIEDLDHINNILKKNEEKENHIIFAMLIKYMKSGDTNISIIDKQKSKDNIVDLLDHGLRLRRSEEVPIDSKKLKTIIPMEKDIKHIIFRYVQRASLMVCETDSFIVRIDLSYTQSSNKISLLNKKSPTIELEIELSFKKTPTTKDKQKIPTIINATYRNLMKVLQQSNIVMNPGSQELIVKKMHKTLFPDKELEIKDLPAMNSVSSELIHIVDYINHDYCVTDKADGERHFMFIDDGRIYLINNLNEVKEIEAPDGVEEYNLSIFDGEYLYNDEHGKFMFLIFDCLCFKGIDKMEEKMLETRLEYVKEFTYNVYGQEHAYEKYSEKFDYDKMKKFYIKGLSQHMYELVSRFEDDADNIVSMKYFMFPLGIKPWEIFFLTSLLFELYTTSMEVNGYTIQCPYNIDGCMWTPIEQEYTRLANSVKRKIYKYKPPKDNSIDCYCEYARDPSTKAIMDVFDNADANMQFIDMDNEEFDKKTKNNEISNIKAKDQIYRIIYLYVGKTKGNSEYPVLFNEDKDLHYAYVYLVDGEARDVEGNIIQDKTVVEWTYKNDITVKPGSRWIPLRTRHDKTESVNLHKRKYGNNVMIANKVWRSMTDGIEVSDINLLGDPKTYDAHHSKLKSHITSTMTETQRRENSFYNLVSNVEEPLKKFHSWMKQNLILAYCGSKDTGNGLESLDVLEYGIGRGGDIPKYLHARINSMTGFDIDYFGIYSGSDSATSRYHTYKKKRGVIGFDMKFLVCDGGAPLTLKDQHNAGVESTEENDKAIKYIFDNPNPKLYDVVSCQFVVHFFFKSDYTLNSFIGNLVRFVKPSGYVLLTTYDDKILHEELVRNNGTSTTYHTTKEGEKVVLYDLIKHYDGNVQDITGQAINVHLPVFDKDKYNIEYVVPKNLLTTKMEENGFELVETDLFWNTFIKHKMFFESGVTSEHGDTRNFYMSVKEYYNSDDHLNKLLYPHTKKHRYYVFQKLDDGTYVHSKHPKLKARYTKKVVKKDKYKKR